MPNFNSQHLHLPHFNFKIDNTHNLRMLYGIRSVKEVTSKMIFFFLPLFLYDLGPKLTMLDVFGFNDFQKGMISVAAYFIFFRVAMITSVMWVGKAVVNWLGSRNAMVISRVLAILVFLLLKESANIHWLIFAAALLDGLEGAFFWPLFHSVFGKNAVKRRVGEDLGILSFIQQFIAMAAPAIGGLLVIILGYESLFMVGLIFSFLGIIFAVSLDDEKFTVEPKYKQLFAWLKEDRFRKMCASFIGRYINDVLISIWPLYVFLILGSADKVGYLYSISLFIAMFLTLFVGFYIDHHKGRRPFFLSGGALSLVWLLRTRVFDIWSIIFIDAADRILSSFHWLFYESILLKRGRGKTVYPFFIYREIMISIGSFAVWAVFLSIFIFWGDWRTLFILGAVGTLISVLMTEKPQLLKD